MIKTLDEVIWAVEHCDSIIDDCANCPYLYEDCENLRPLRVDALHYLQELQEIKNTRIYIPEGYIQPKIGDKN